MYEVYKYSTIEKKKKKRESMKENGLESEKGEEDGNRAEI